MKSSFKSTFSASMWGMFATAATGISQFISVPLLIGYYGKNHYGLIVLSYSIFTYMRMFDLGLSSGTIRFGSIWLATKQYSKLESIFQSNIITYGVIGIINAIILISIGNSGSLLLKLDTDQESIFLWMMWILALSSLIEWQMNILVEIFSSHDELGWINRMIIVKNVVLLIGVLFVVLFKVSSIWYFSVYIIASLAQIPFYLLRSLSKKIPLRTYLQPKWQKAVFKEVIVFSSAIFTMRIFQVSANYLRPVLLGIFAVGALGIVAEYNVIQTISAIVMAFGGVFGQILLPLTTKSLALNERSKIDSIVYSGTKYITILLGFLIFGLIINVNSIIIIYVGPEFENLSAWIIIALMTLFGLHYSPVSSLIMSNGKVLPLTLTSIANSILSITALIYLIPIYNVGGAVLSYLLYTILQLIVVYFYYIPFVLKLDSIKLFFKSFLIPLILGGISAFMIIITNNYFTFDSLLIRILINSLLFVIIYVSLCLAFVLKPTEVRLILAKIR